MNAPDEVIVKYNSEFIEGIISSFNSIECGKTDSHVQLLSELLDLLVLDEKASAAVALYLVGDNGEGV